MHTPIHNPNMQKRVVYTQTHTLHTPSWKSHTYKQTWYMSTPMCTQVNMHAFILIPFAPSRKHAHAPASKMQMHSELTHSMDDAHTHLTLCVHVTQAQDPGAVMQPWGSWCLTLTDPPQVTSSFLWSSKILNYVIRVGGRNDAFLEHFVTISYEWAW